MARGDYARAVKSRAPIYPESPLKKNWRQKKAERLKAWTERRLGGEFRRFRLTATENTLNALATMPDPPNLNRLPGFFITEIRDKRIIENGLESVDSMTLRLGL